MKDSEETAKLAEKDKKADKGKERKDREYE